MVVLGFLLTFLLSDPSASPIKVGGETFVPKGLIFSESPPEGRVTGQAALSDGCEWVLESETRLASKRVEKERPEEDCLQHFYKTRVVLAKRCPAPAKPLESSSERITARSPECPDAGAAAPSPSSAVRAISSGTTPDGRSQEIVIHPDGTRLTIQWDDQSVSVQIRYPDGSTDRMSQTAEVSPKAE